MPLASMFIFPLSFLMGLNTIFLKDKIGEEKMIQTFKFFFFGINKKFKLIRTNKLLFLSFVQQQLDVDVSN